MESPIREWNYCSLAGEELGLSFGYYILKDGGFENIGVSFWDSF